MNVLRKPTGTVVKNHYVGDTYAYFAATYQGLPKVWTQYQIMGITGEVFLDNKDRFRIGTRYVRVVLLLNNGQTAAEKTVFGNLEFKELPVIKFLW